MFKGTMLIASAATLICGSVWAADDAARNPATAPAADVAPQDSAAPFEEKTITRKMDLLAKEISSAESRLEKLKQNDEEDSRAAKSLRAQILSLQNKMQSLISLRDDYAVAQARIKSLEMIHDGLQKQLAAAGLEYGPNSPVLAKLREQLQLVDVQIASIQDITNLKTAGAQGAQIVDGAYLGLSTEPVTDALARQLKLEPGFGLIVQSIVPGSPAESAGIKKFDILTRFDDQMLITPVQLQTLIRSRKPDHQIKITLIHQGQTTTVTARLAKGFSVRSPAMTEVPRMEWVPATPGSFTISPSNSLLLRRVGTNEVILSANHLEIHDKNHKSIFSGSVETPEQRRAVPQEFQEVLGQMLEKQKAMTPSTQPDTATALGSNPDNTSDKDSALFTGRSLEPAAGATVNQRLILWAHNSHTLVLTFQGNTPAHLLAKDVDGKTLFDGPVETREQQDKIPADLREGFDFLSQHPESGENLLKQ
jgi:hypothetical protein